MRYYLAVNYGACEGWRLEEMKTPKDAIDRIMKGGVYGTEIKILQELDVAVSGEQNPDLMAIWKVSNLP